MTASLSELLSTPLASSLLSTHPNELAANGFHHPSEWSSWWDWAAGTHGDPFKIQFDQEQTDDEQPPWLSLIRFYTDPSSEINTTLPDCLRSLLLSVRTAQLDRTPAPLSAIAARSNHSKSSTSVGIDFIIDAHGMSPKKQHEVERMASYLAALLASTPELRRIKHAVDVGAGQGYISRVLSTHLGLHVLALDSNANQTVGAERRLVKAEKRGSKRTKKGNDVHLSTSQAPLGEAFGVERDPDIGEEQDRDHVNDRARGSITHKTAYITPETLRAALDEWMDELNSDRVQGHDYDTSKNHPNGGKKEKNTEPTPILIVALHACGSLTPDILRTHLAGGGRGWTPAALVVVGCCYNLLREEDFPLSSLPRNVNEDWKAAAAQPGTFATRMKLTAAHMQLAAQVPAHWLDSRESIAKAVIATRKVVFRALLQPFLESASSQKGIVNEPSDVTSTLPPQTNEDGLNVPEDLRDRAGTGETVANRRLGKLSASAYVDWPTFLRTASEKMGVSLDSAGEAIDKAPAINSSERGIVGNDEGRQRMASRLAVLHVLRCILGVAVESLIILDRRQWVSEILHKGQKCLSEGNPPCGRLGEGETDGAHTHVRLVNLFDQSTGSGRNVAIVITEGNSSV